MKTIYKYPFQVDDQVDLKLPWGARILSVQKQRRSLPGELELWALIDTEESPADRRLIICGTGHDASYIAQNDLRHIATVLEQDGALVWHVFEDM
jgi:hypothetical protein